MRGDVGERVDDGPEVFRIREFADDPARFEPDARGKIGERLARLELSRPRDAAAASDILGVGDGQVLRHLLPLAEEGGVGRSGAQCLQLSEEGAAGQGKGVGDFRGAELMEKADAVPFAAREDGFHLPPSEAFNRRLAGDVEDGVETFEPVGMAGHEGKPVSFLAFKPNLDEQIHSTRCGEVLSLVEREGAR